MILSERLFFLLRTWFYKKNVLYVYTSLNAAVRLSYKAQNIERQNKNKKGSKKKLNKQNELNMYYYYEGKMLYVYKI